MLPLVLAIGVGAVAWWLLKETPSPLTDDSVYSYKNIPTTKDAAYAAGEARGMADAKAGRPMGPFPPAVAVWEIAYFAGYSAGWVKGGGK